jgi:hypothetical protein
MAENNNEVNYEKDGILKLMKLHNIPVTRENYLDVAYMGDIPEMTPELESQLPEFLRKE